MPEGKVRDLSRQIAARIAGTMIGWFGPGTPQQQTAPQGTSVRQFDYETGVNLTYTPRKNEPITFEQMRLLADNSYLMRVIIEKVKDRICEKRWALKLSSKDGELEQSTKERAAQDPRIKKLRQLFLYPDGEYSWQTWLRALLEEMIVTDAASIYPWRSKGKEIQRLMLVDGATINRILNDYGMTPMPDDPQPIAYQQIIHGVVANELRASDLVYAPRNVRTHKIYGFSPVEQTILLLNTQILRSVWQQNAYDESNIPQAFGFLPKDWSADEMTRFARNFDAELNGNLADRRRIYWMPDTGKPIQVIKNEDMHDKFDEWLARVFSYALGEPPTALVQQNNRATAQQGAETAEETGERPLMAWVVDTVNKLIQHPLYFGFDDIEFNFDDSREADGLEQAQIDQIQVLIGTRTANELRERDGLAPLEEEEEEEQQDEDDDSGDGKPSQSDDEDSDGSNPQAKPKKPSTKALRQSIEHTAGVLKRKKKRLNTGSIWY